MSQNNDATSLAGDLTAFPAAERAEFVHLQPASEIAPSVSGDFYDPPPPRTPSPPPPGALTVDTLRELVRRSGLHDLDSDYFKGASLFVKGLYLWKGAGYWEVGYSEGRGGDSPPEDFGLFHSEWEACEHFWKAVLSHGFANSAHRPPKR